MRKSHSCENKMAKQSFFDFSELELISNSSSESDDEFESNERLIESIIGLKRKSHGRNVKPMAKRVAVDDAHGQEPKAK